MFKIIRVPSSNSFKIVDFQNGSFRLKMFFPTEYFAKELARYLSRVNIVESIILLFSS